jgi:hypothetical protein
MALPPIGGTVVGLLEADPADSTATIAGTDSRLSFALIDWSHKARNDRHKRYREFIYLGSIYNHII